MAIKSANKSKLAEAVRQNQETVLDVIDHEAVLRKAGDIVQSKIKTYMTSKFKDCKILLSTGEWSPDQAPAQGLEDLHKFVVSCV